MASVREIGRGLPKAEYNTKECLQRLLDSKEFAEHHPRFTKDGWLVKDGCEIHTCAFTGDEFVNPDMLVPVLYKGPAVVVRTLIPYVYHERHGWYDIALVSKDVVEDYLDTSITEFRYYDNRSGNVSMGYFVRMDNAGHDGTLYRAIQDTIEHECDGDTWSCPEWLMVRISECVTDVNGVHYYSYDRIPDDLRYRDEEDDEDDSDEDSDDGVAEYHSLSRERARWKCAQYGDISKERWVGLTKRHQYGRLFGVELEMFAKGDRNEVAIVAAQYGLLAEQDGSLDDHQGVEIIGPPMTYNEYVSPDGKWRKFLERATRIARGWTAGSDYGMHVSLNRLAMTPATAAKVYAAFHHMDELCTCIAGRRSTYANFVPRDSRRPYNQQCSWNRGVLIGPPLIYGLGLNDHSETIKAGCSAHETDKYESASLRGQSRLEVRIFRSCLNWDRFIRNIQFCAAMWAWAESCSLQDCVNDKLFCQWLQGQQHHYPELCSFIANLRPQTFVVSNSKVKKMCGLAEANA